MSLRDLFFGNDNESEDTKVSEELKNEAVASENKDGNLIRSKYIQQTDEYDPIGSSYLTSHHYYHLIPESFNGWKETTQEHYDWFIDMYVPKCDNHSNLNFDRIYKDASEVKISGED